MDKTVELSETEMRILVACVRAAFFVEFYTFDYDDKIGVVETEDIIRLLAKLGENATEGDWFSLL